MVGAKKDVVSGAFEVDGMDGSVALVVLISDVGMVGSLVGEGVLVTPVTPVPMDDAVGMPVTPVATDEVVSTGADDVVTPVETKVEDSTPVPGPVMPEAVGTLVAADVGASVETISEVGIEMMVSVETVGREVTMPVPVG